MLGTLSITHIVWWSNKLLLGHCRGNALKTEPKWLFCSTLAFVLICVLSLIKCILYGLVHCDYIYLSSSFQDTVFGILFQDLYAFQLYFFWVVLVLRLYCIFQGTAYTLSITTIRIYSGIFLGLPMLTPLVLSPNLGQIFIVLSFSISLFITLSITILYGFKLIQVYRYHSLRPSDRYVRQHGVDLVTVITKNTILVLISTLFSFAILLILIFMFVISVYGHEIPYQQQVLDMGLLTDAYITGLCVLLQFQYLDSKYQFCCSCIDIVCRFYCDKYLSSTRRHRGPFDTRLLTTKQACR